MQNVMQYKKPIFALILIILLACIYYFMFIKTGTTAIVPVVIPEVEVKDETTSKVTDALALPETKSNSSIISLKDVENYSLVTDGDISLSLAEDDTYLMD